jgi:hypothetical protein
VHNDGRGLPAEAIQKLSDLRAAYPEISIDVFSYPEIRRLVLALQPEQLEDLFGAVPSQRTLERLSFAELQPVLLSIQRQEPSVEPPLMAPSARKLQNNGLSRDAADFLRQDLLNDSRHVYFWEANRT